MVNQAPRGRRGGSTLGCVVSIVILALATYCGVQFGQPWFRYYQLLDEMEISARLGPSLTDAVIHRRLEAKAKELGLPPEGHKFTIKRTGNPRKIIITTEYSETVTIPLFSHTFVFAPKVEEPI
jgi:hypothetical protein